MKHHCLELFAWYDVKVSNKANVTCDKSKKWKSSITVTNMAATPTRQQVYSGIGVDNNLKARMHWGYLPEYINDARERYSLV